MVLTEFNIASDGNVNIDPRMSLEDNRDLRTNQGWYEDRIRWRCDGREMKKRWKPLAARGCLMLNKHQIRTTLRLYNRYSDQRSLDKQLSWNQMIISKGDSLPALQCNPSFHAEPYLETQVWAMSKRRVIRTKHLQIKPTRSRKKYTSWRSTVVKGFHEGYN